MIFGHSENVSYAFISPTGGHSPHLTGIGGSRFFPKQSGNTEMLCAIIWIPMLFTGFSLMSMFRNWRHSAIQRPGFQSASCTRTSLGRCLLFCPVYTSFKSAAHLLLPVFVTVLSLPYFESLSGSSLCFPVSSFQSHSHHCLVVELSCKAKSLFWSQPLPGHCCLICSDHASPPFEPPSSV